MSAPNVFISYSHDSEEHKTWVRKLAADLRAAGIDATLDQWELAFGQDLAAFMYNGIAKAHRVLLICSETYVAKSEGGMGGVGYEGLIVTAEVVEAIDTKKFIPLIRSNTSGNKTPKHLGKRMYIDFSSDDNYGKALEDLCRELLGFPSEPKPPLGQNPFSGSISSVSSNSRDVNTTGILTNGQSVLSGTWFEQESIAANNGIDKLKLSGKMELRFALHTMINKSQVDLLTAVRSAEITTFGWPIGVLLENRPEYKPKPFGDGIRAEIAMTSDQITGAKSYDYWVLTRSGDFFLLQSLFEDSRAEGELFFNTRIVRVTEALMFAERLYQSLGVPAGTMLSVRVSHQGLNGRRLSSATHRRLVMGKRISYTDNGESEIVVTLGAIHETLVENTKRLLAPLFMLFEFAEFNEEVYEDIVRKFENGEAT